MAQAMTVADGTGGKANGFRPQNGAATAGHPRVEEDGRGPAATAAAAGGLRPADIVPGGRDQCGREVSWVYWSTDGYAIYQWERKLPGRFAGWPARTERALSAHFTHPDQRLNYARIGCDLSRICALQRGLLACGEAVNREIARAMALALEGYVEDARDILAHLRARLLALRSIEGRAWYLGACVAFMLALLGLQVLAACFPGTAQAVLGADPMPLKVVSCGALGAFLSVCLRIRRLEIDPEAPRQINGVFGITRLVIGIAAGLIVYLAVLSKLVMPSLLPGAGVPSAEGGAWLTPDQAGILLLAVVAGFSEVFVPNILRKVGGAGGDEGARDPAGAAAKADDGSTTPAAGGGTAGGRPGTAPRGRRRGPSRTGGAPDGRAAAAGEA